MATKKVLTRRKVLKAIDGSAGVMMTISKRCGCGYATIWDYFNHPDNKDLKDMLLEEREKLVDVAENKLYKKVQEEDWNAIKFTLSTIGAKRGFQEKHEVEHKGFDSIKISFENPNEPKIIEMEKVKKEIEVKEEC